MYLKHWQKIFFTLKLKSEINSFKIQYFIYRFCCVCFFVTPKLLILFLTSDTPDLTMSQTCACNIFLGPIREKEGNNLKECAKYFSRPADSSHAEHNASLLSLHRILFSVKKKKKSKTRYDIISYLVFCKLLNSHSNNIQKPQLWW